MQGLAAGFPAAGIFTMKIFLRTTDLILLWDDGAAGAKNTHPENQTRSLGLGIGVFGLCKAPGGGHKTTKQKQT